MTTITDHTIARTALIQDAAERQARMLDRVTGLTEDGAALPDLAAAGLALREEFEAYHDRDCWFHKPDRVGEGRQSCRACRAMEVFDAVLARAMGGGADHA